MKIVDSVYGVEEIEDDVLIDLINSKNIQRLKGVAQGGLPARYCAQPVFSRYDHSVGVMVLLRKIGADLNEQIAGILHDLSHTTFSHLIDWVIGDPKKQNYQDNQYGKVLRNSDCAKILEKYSFDVLDFIDIEKYKLLERETPDLCADRIDYCLRDLVARGRKKFSNEFIKHLIIHNGEIVFDSEPIAYQFAHEFLSLQNYSWAEVIHSTRFSIFAEVLKRALSLEIINRNDFEGVDEDILEKLENSKDSEILGKLKIVKKGFTLKFSSKGIEIRDKFRFVDPKVFSDGQLKRVSEFSPYYSEFVNFSRSYFNSRKFVEVFSK